MTTPPLTSTLRVDSLRLENFRGFESCDAILHPKLTVLVAENGRGKTALLDAIGIALGRLIDTISRVRLTTGFARSDARISWANGTPAQPHVPVLIAASGIVDGTRISWEMALPSVTSQRARTTTRNARSLVKAASELKSRLEAHATGKTPLAPPLPLVAFYGTGRLWGDRRLTRSRRTSDPTIAGRLEGYIDCLAPSSSFKVFEMWYKRTRDEAAHGSALAFPPDRHPIKLLAAVRHAVRTVLEPAGWQDLDCENSQLVAESPSLGRLPLSMLSDGVRNMIALVGDIAHRCVRLNPHFGEMAAQMTPGIVLIDEVDMHLHPSWQQRIIGLLQTAFPAMQIVVSTHSPHVLSTVDAESIRIIRLNDGIGTLTTPTYQTRGVESADVLARIMDVDPIPPVPEATWAREYRAFAESGQHDMPEALDLHRRLVSHFGQNHPVMIELDTLARFQLFRRSRMAAQTNLVSPGVAPGGGGAVFTGRLDTDERALVEKVQLRRKD